MRLPPEGRAGVAWGRFAGAWAGPRPVSGGSSPTWERIRRTGGGLGAEGDDAQTVRYRLDCRRLGSQGQRSFRVADCPFADS